MVSIKIQCGCGQKYSFDVEPSNGVMPYAIVCPICGADGTTAANAAIAQALPVAQPAVAPAPALAFAQSGSLASSPAPAVALRAAPPALGNRVVSNTVPRRSALHAKEIDYAQVEAEMRARVFWGDERQEVIKFGMLQGLSSTEATDLVQPMFEERFKTIRRNGFGKIIGGSLMTCVPIAAYFYFAHIGIFPMKLFALTIMVGLYGGYLLIKGIIMVVAPKSEPGNVAEQ